MALVSRVAAISSGAPNLSASSMRLWELPFGSPHLLVRCNSKSRPARSPIPCSGFVVKGLPQFGAAKHGDLFVEVSVREPEKLSSAERKLFEQLRALQLQHRKGA